MTFRICELKSLDIRLKDLKWDYTSLDILNFSEIEVSKITQNMDINLVQGNKLKDMAPNTLRRCSFPLKV